VSRIQKRGRVQKIWHGAFENFTAERWKISRRGDCLRKVLARAEGKGGSAQIEPLGTILAQARCIFTKRARVAGMVITKFGEQRVRAEGFGEFCAALIAANGIETARFYVGAILAEDAMGMLAGNYAAFEKFIETNDGIILSHLLMHVRGVSN
jgi:hypothetical protein